MPSHQIYWILLLMLSGVFGLQRTIDFTESTVSTQEFDLSAGLNLDLILTFSGVEKDTTWMDYIEITVLSEGTLWLLLSRDSDKVLGPYYPHYTLESNVTTSVYLHYSDPTDLFFFFASNVSLTAQIHFERKRQVFSVLDVSSPSPQKAELFRLRVNRSAFATDTIAMLAFVTDPASPSLVLCVDHVDCIEYIHPLFVSQGGETTLFSFRSLNNTVSIPSGQEEVDLFIHPQQSASFKVATFNLTVVEQELREEFALQLNFTRDESGAFIAALSDFVAPELFAVNIGFPVAASRLISIEAVCSDTVQLVLEPSYPHCLTKNECFNYAISALELNFTAEKPLQHISAGTIFSGRNVDSTTIYATAWAINAVRVSCNIMFKLVETRDLILGDLDSSVLTITPSILHNVHVSFESDDDEPFADLFVFSRLSPIIGNLRGRLRTLPFGQPVDSIIIDEVTGTTIWLQIQNCCVTSDAVIELSGTDDDDDVSMQSYSTNRYVSFRRQRLTPSEFTTKRISSTEGHLFYGVWYAARLPDSADTVAVIEFSTLDPDTPELTEDDIEWAVSVSYWPGDPMHCCMDSNSSAHHTVQFTSFTDIDGKSGLVIPMSDVFTSLGVEPGELDLFVGYKLIQGDSSSFYIPIGLSFLKYDAVSHQIGPGQASFLALEFTDTNTHLFHESAPSLLSGGTRQLYLDFMLYIQANAMPDGTVISLTYTNQERLILCKGSTYCSVERRLCELLPPVDAHPISVQVTCLGASCLGAFTISVTLTSLYDNVRYFETTSSNKKMSASLELFPFQPTALRFKEDSASQFELGEFSKVLFYLDSGVSEDTNALYALDFEFNSFPAFPDNQLQGSFFPTLDCALSISNTDYDFENMVSVHVFRPQPKDLCDPPVQYFMFNASSSSYSCSTASGKDTFVLTSRYPYRVFVSALYREYSAQTDFPLDLVVPSSGQMYSGDFHHFFVNLTIPDGEKLSDVAHLTIHNEGGSSEKNPTLYISPGGLPGPVSCQTLQDSVVAEVNQDVFGMPLLKADRAYYFSLFLPLSSDLVIRDFRYRISVQRNDERSLLQLDEPKVRQIYRASKEMLYFTHDINSSAANILRLRLLLDSDTALTPLGLRIFLNTDRTSSWSYQCFTAKDANDCYVDFSSCAFAVTGSVDHPMFYIEQSTDWATRSRVDFELRQVLVALSPCYSSDCSYSVIGTDHYHQVGHFYVDLPSEYFDPRFDWIEVEIQNGHESVDIDLTVQYSFFHPLVVNTFASDDQHESYGCGDTGHRTISFTVSSASTVSFQIPSCEGFSWDAIKNQLYFRYNYESSEVLSAEKLLGRVLVRSVPYVNVLDGSVCNGSSSEGYLSCRYEPNAGLQHFLLDRDFTLLPGRVIEFDAAGSPYYLSIEGPFLGSNSSGCQPFPDLFQGAVPIHFRLLGTDFFVITINSTGVLVDTVLQIYYGEYLELKESASEFLSVTVQDYAVMIEPSSEHIYRLRVEGVSDNIQLQLQSAPCAFCKRDVSYELMIPGSTLYLYLGGVSRTHNFILSPLNGTIDIFTESYGRAHLFELKPGRFATVEVASFVRFRLYSADGKFSSGLALTLNDSVPIQVYVMPCGTVSEFYKAGDPSQIEIDGVTEVPFTGTTGYVPLITEDVSYIHREEEYISMCADIVLMTTSSVEVNAIVLESFLYLDFDFDPQALMCYQAPCAAYIYLFETDTGTSLENMSISLLFNSDESSSTYTFYHINLDEEEPSPGYTKLTKSNKVFLEMSQQDQLIYLQFTGNGTLSRVTLNEVESDIHPDLSSTVTLNSSSFYRPIIDFDLDYEYHSIFFELISPCCAQIFTLSLFVSDPTLTSSYQVFSILMHTSDDVFAQESIIVRSNSTLYLHFDVDDSFSDDSVAERLPMSVDFEASYRAISEGHMGVPLECECQTQLCSEDESCVLSVAYSYEFFSLDWSLIVRNLKTTITQSTEVLPVLIDTLPRWTDSTIGAGGTDSFCTLNLPTDTTVPYRKDLAECLSVERFDLSSQLYVRVPPGRAIVVDHVQVFQHVQTIESHRQNVDENPVTISPTIGIQQSYVFEVDVSIFEISLTVVDLASLEGYSFVFTGSTSFRELISDDNIKVWHFYRVSNGDVISVKVAWKADMGSAEDLSESAVTVLFKCKPSVPKKHFQSQSASSSSEGMSWHSAEGVFVRSDVVYFQVEADRSLVTEYIGLQINAGVNGDPLQPSNSFDVSVHYSQCCDDDRSTQVTASSGLNLPLFCLLQNASIYVQLYNCGGNITSDESSSIEPECRYEITLRVIDSKKVSDVVPTQFKELDVATPTKNRSLSLIRSYLGAIEFFNAESQVSSFAQLNLPLENRNETDMMFISLFNVVVYEPAEATLMISTDFVGRPDESMCMGGYTQHTVLLNQTELFVSYRFLATSTERLFLSLYNVKSLGLSAVIVSKFAIVLRNTTEIKTYRITQGEFRAKYFLLEDVDVTSGKGITLILQHFHTHTDSKLTLRVLRPNQMVQLDSDVTHHATDDCLKSVTTSANQSVETVALDVLFMIQNFFSYSGSSSTVTVPIAVIAHGESSVVFNIQTLQYTLSLPTMSLGDNLESRSQIIQFDAPSPDQSGFYAIGVNHTSNVQLEFEILTSTQELSPESWSQSWTVHVFDFRTLCEQEESFFLRVLEDFDANVTIITQLILPAEIDLSDSFELSPGEFYHFERTLIHADSSMQDFPVYLGIYGRARLTVIDSSRTAQIIQTSLAEEVIDDWVSINVADCNGYIKEFFIFARENSHVVLKLTDPPMNTLTSVPNCDVSDPTICDDRLKDGFAIDAFHDEAEFICNGLVEASYAFATYQRYLMFLTKCYEVGPYCSDLAQRYACNRAFPPYGGETLPLDFCEEMELKCPYLLRVLDLSCSMPLFDAEVVSPKFTYFFMKVFLVAFICFLVVSVIVFTSVLNLSRRNTQHRLLSENLNRFAASSEDDDLGLPLLAATETFSLD